MQTLRQQSRDYSGYAMIMTMVLSGVSLLLLSAALNWTSTSARLVQRNNEFHGNASAAEAAIDKVVAKISNDYQASDEATVYSRLTDYQKLVPTQSENPLWSGYEFSNGSQQVGKTYVDRLTAPAWGVLPSGYSSLQGTLATYRIISNARNLDPSGQKSVSAVRRDIGLASIPLFEFGIFYAVDMEFNPIDTWTVTGPVHCNGTIYVEPAKTLTFNGKVTATQKVVHDRSPKDPVDRTAATIVYNAGRVEQVKSLNLPLDGVLSPEYLREIIEVPPPSESATSALGKQRFFNKADMIIYVTDTAVTATSGSYNAFATSVPSATLTSILTTNLVMFDKRESIDMRLTELDISLLNTKLASLTTLLGRQPKTIYIQDKRTPSPVAMSAVRLVNGLQLPAGGLTIATPNPLYVKGSYNAPTMVVKVNGKSTTVADPSKRYGACLVSDALTFLSNSWKDNQSANSLSSRTVSAAATLNAAVITGIVPSDGVYYSGGVEGTIRFLEYWGTRTMTWSGSVVVLYYSKEATAPWGASSDVYELPTRSWSWDSTFADPTKLPPGAPEIRTVIRSQWANVAPGTIK